MSLFSAEARAAGPADLGGLLCGPGQIVCFGAGETARLSIVLADPARAPAVLAACTAVGAVAVAVRTDNGSTAVRTAFRRDLLDRTGRPLPGQSHEVPADLQLDGTLLRLWALAAGAPDGRGGYLLTLDPHAPQTHDPLIAAATRAGLPPARTRGPALRIGGALRVRRLVELVGPPPPGVSAQDWPRWRTGRAAGPG